MTGLAIKDVGDMEVAARKLVEMGAHAVIVKGGHMEKAVDVLLDGNELHLLSGDRVKLEHTHGTGCTFASAIAAQLAAGKIVAGGDHAGQGLRHEGHRTSLSGRKGAITARPLLPHED